MLNISCRYRAFTRLSNSYNGNESILKGFNELLTDLNSLDSVNSLNNVINHILKHTNNISLKNICVDIDKNKSQHVMWLY